jgi:hypothetical protein
MARVFHSLILLLDRATQAEMDRMVDYLKTKIRTTSVIPLNIASCRRGDPAQVTNQRRNRRWLLACAEGFHLG